MNNLFWIIVVIVAIIPLTIQQCFEHEEKMKQAPMDTVALRKHLEQEYCRECVERALLKGTPKATADSTCKSLYIR